MSRYYNDFLIHSEDLNTLTHFGVPGMKWGVRKQIVNRLGLARDNHKANAAYRKDLLTLNWKGAGTRLGNARQQARAKYEDKKATKVRKFTKGDQKMLNRISDFKKRRLLGKLTEGQRNDLDRMEKYYTDKKNGVAVRRKGISERLSEKARLGKSSHIIAKGAITGAIGNAAMTKILGGDRNDIIRNGIHGAASGAAASAIGNIVARKFTYKRQGRVG